VRVINLRIVLYRVVLAFHSNNVPILHVCEI